MAITFEEDVREENVADLLQWISFILSLCMTVFFAREIKYGICGWEGKTPGCSNCMNVLLSCRS